MTIPQGFPKLDTPLVDMGTGRVEGKQADVGTGHISRPWYRFMINLWNRTGGSSGNNFLPIGVSAIWNGEVGDVPGGCLVEDGSAISRTEWAALFSIIGVKFGAGDGISTFNLPNRIGKFTYGGLTVGASGGAEQVALSVANLPSHFHPITDPGHHHTQQVHNGAAGVAGAQGTDAVNDTSVGVTDNAVTGITQTGSVGGGTPVPILPPYLVGIPIIGAI